MTLLYVDGFDARDYALRWAGGNTSSATTGRFGVGSAMVVNGSPYRRFTPSAKVVCGFGYMLINAGASGFREFMRLMGDNSATTHLNLMQTGMDLFLIRGGVTIATALNAFPPGGGWSYIEMSATIDDTAGRAIVKVNGNTVIDFTGDTRNGGTSTLLDTLYFIIPATGGGPSIAVDDVYILNGIDSGIAGSPQNDFLGDVRIFTVAPTAPGASTQLTPSSGTNWGAVDDLPYNANDYVSGNASGLKDTYVASDLPTGITKVHGVQVNSIAKKTDAGSRAIKNVIRRGATDYADASAINLATSDMVFSSLRVVDPSTSAPWTPTNVNAMEIGVEVI